MRIIKKIVAFFSEKPAPVNVERMGVQDYDKLIASKLEGIRKFVNQNLDSRDGDELYDKQLGEAFLRYENAIKSVVGEMGHVNSPKTYGSPLNILTHYASYGMSPKPKKITWYKKFTRKRIGRWFTRLYRRTKFKIQLYWQHIMLMREIHKMKKIFPMVSKNQALNLINASKLNKKMIENRI